MDYVLEVEKLTSNDYISRVINTHYIPRTISDPAEINACDTLNRIIRDWAGNCLCDIKISGSRAKGTAIDLSSDLDLFISLSSTTSNSLSEIYNSLYNTILLEGLEARKQNVSIGVLINNKKIDLVPAKRQSQFGNDHSLYKNKTDSWTQTNIDKHISSVINSGRHKEIIALKICRENHNLEFPSILIETITINALKGHSISNTADNFIYMLRYIKDYIQNVRVLDPANTNNIISDDITKYEKKLLAQQAINSIYEPNWERIIW